MQGLVGLSEDQPLQGEICKLHNKGNKSETRHENEAKTDVVTNETVKDDSNNAKVEKDKGTVKLKEIRRRQTYINTKIKLRKAKQTILKCNQKGTNPKTKCDHNVKVDSVPKKEEKETEGREKSDLSEMNMLHMQVETMIKQGKTDADSIRKINTLKSILAMFNKPEDICKKDDQPEKNEIK